MGYLLSEKRKQYLRTKIIQGAQLYKQYLLGKHFLVVCEDGKKYTIWFPKEKYKHLTGINSNLNDKRFYNNCITQQLSEGNIMEYQKYNWATLKNKADRISKIHEMLYTDTDNSLFLLNLHTRTQEYPVAIRNDNLDACIGFANSDNRVSTLRKAKNSINSDEQKKIIAIFSKERHEEKFNSIVYLTNIDLTKAVEDMADWLSENLLGKFNSIYIESTVVEEVAATEIVDNS